MYTDSVEKELQFLASLLFSQDTEMADGETVAVGICPKCHKGTVFTRCKHGFVNNVFHSWSYDHYCDVCKEKFVPGRIRSDIFFHKPHEMVEALNTPFGYISVKINGQTKPFRHRIETYDPDEGEPVTMHVIDIDLSGLKPDDVVFCGFEEEILEYNDGDERSILYSCENGQQILGVCAYEPYEYDLKYCCFQLEDYTPKGFGYRVVSDPRQFNELEFYQSKITSLAVTWLNKAEYADADLVMFLALTCVIG